MEGIFFIILISMETSAIHGLYCSEAILQDLNKN
jgi:hypothetical protein